MPIRWRMFPLPATRYSVSNWLQLFRKRRLFGASSIRKHILWVPFDRRKQLPELPTFSAVSKFQTIVSINLNEWRGSSRLKSLVYLSLNVYINWINNWISLYGPIFRSSAFAGHTVMFCNLQYEQVNTETHKTVTSHVFFFL
jgi:hypothetical protein